MGTGLVSRDSSDQENWTIPLLVTEALGGLGPGEKQNLVVDNGLLLERYKLLCSHPTQKIDGSARDGAVRDN